MRITILGLNYAPEPTGIAPYTSSLAEGLSKLGHEVRVVTTFAHYPEWRFREKEVPHSSNELINGVKVLRLRHYVPTRPSGIRRLLSELSFGNRLLWANWGNPDVILLVSPALFASRLAQLRARIGPRRPSIALWIQDLYGLGVSETSNGSKGLVARIVTIAEKSMVRRSDSVAVIHDRFRDHAVRTLGARLDDVVIIRNWMHLSAPGEVNRNESRKALGWGEEETIVLHAGNMGVKQGLSNVVAAAAQADADELPIRFVLMGNGSQRKMLEEEARGVQRITFIDPLPDEGFARALRSADILLVNELPGVAEMAVPSKLTSYFSTGLPVLAATGGDGLTASELHASGAGLHVEAGNPSELLLAAMTLRCDPDFAATLGRLGPKYVAEMLSEDAAIVKSSSWLEGLATRKRGFSGR